MKDRIFAGILMFFTIPLLQLQAQNITITDSVIDAGQNCFKIETAAATYFYQKEAGGFSSILDNDSADWIDFKPAEEATYPASAANEYRGLPNMVYGGDDDGAGHPGFSQCESFLVNDSVIRTVSKSGKWEWEWTFFDDHAKLEVLKADADRGYWFLYEGIPGGSFMPDHYFWGNGEGGPYCDMPDFFMKEIDNGNWQWAYFGNDRSYNIFYVAREQKGDENCIFGVLGNTKQGITSPNGMVVFGFGREGTQSLLKGRNTFYIGFAETDGKNIPGLIQEKVHRFIISKDNL